MGKKALFAENFKNALHPLSVFLLPNWLFFLVSVYYQLPKSFHKIRSIYNSRNIQNEILLLKFLAETYQAYILLKNLY